MENVQKLNLKADQDMEDNLLEIYPYPQALWNIISMCIILSQARLFACVPGHWPKITSPCQFDL